MSAASRELQPADMPLLQGLVVSAYAHLPCAAYRLLLVTDAPQARRWLRALADEVTTAAGPRADASLNVALTHDGLRALGTDADCLRTFPLAFQDGMACERRSRVLGDTGDDAPDGWTWGGPRAPVHVLLLEYGRDERRLAVAQARWAPGADDGVRTVAVLEAGRQTRDGREHFGFLDGVGQPVVAGSGRLRRQQRRTHHATAVAAGEFVLGFLAEDGRLPPSPTIWCTERTRLLPTAGDRDDRRDVGRHASYLVFRQLEQDVPAFWRWAHEAAAALWPDDPTGPTRLAAKLVGRWPSGAPLVQHPTADPRPGTWDVPGAACPMNDFGYRTDDPHGDACPIGAHIRRANPRDSLGPTAAAALRSARRHRLLRRGRSYGERIAVPLQPDGRARGLHFVCLGADLERQFEFVQQTWLRNPGFAGLAGEVDPLLGPHPAGDGRFTLPEPPLRRRVGSLRAFVRLRGGAYFFLPGLPALRALTAP